MCHDVHFKTQVGGHVGRVYVQEFAHALVCGLGRGGGTQVCVCMTAGNRILLYGYIPMQTITV
jgi:hypothetical protein